jgi:hypothetical protein
MQIDIAAKRAAGALAALAVVTPALAHPGHHHGMSFSELASHLSTGWHLVTLVAAAAIGFAIAIFVKRRQQPGRVNAARRSGDKS